jgi:hypothetical protein
MAGKWNNHALELLTVTSPEQALSPPQIGAIRFLAGFANTGGNRITHLLSHGEARGSKQAGTIANLDAVRATLGLDNDNRKHDQTPLGGV